MDFSLVRTFRERKSNSKLVMEPAVNDSQSSVDPLPYGTAEIVRNTRGGRGVAFE